MKYIYYYFSSCLLIYYCFSFFVVGNTCCFNNDEALEQSSQLGQPIATTLLDGIPSGMWGFWSQETLLASLGYRALGEAPPVTCLAYRTRRPGHTVMCPCVNMCQGQNQELYIDSRAGQRDPTYAN